MPVMEPRSRTTTSKRRNVESQQGLHESDAVDTPKIKRQRVSRACDQCRLGREKCNGTRPSCQTCLSSGRHCTYDTSPKKRGIQPGYIRALELLLGWLFADMNHDAKAALSQQFRQSDSDLRKALAGNDSPYSELVHGRWGSSGINKMLDRLLSGEEDLSLTPEDQEDDSPGERQSQAQDSTMEQSANAPVLALSMQAESLPSHSTSTQGLHDDQTRSMDPDPGYTRFPPPPSVPDVPVTTSSSPSPLVLQLPADFWHLLDVYYTYTHSWLPISEKNDILKAAYSYPAEGCRVLPGSRGSGLHAELYAIIALATLQTASESTDLESAKAICLATALVPLGQDVFEAGHVKALLILSLIYIGRQKLSQAWISIGNAIRIALLLDMDTMASSSGQVSGTTSSRYLHIMLACHVLDSVVARYLGKLPHLPSTVVRRFGLLDSDGLEEWAPWQGVSTTTEKKPARILSVFNNLVEKLIQDKHSESTLPSLGAVISSATAPQQVHLAIVAAWLAYDTDNSTLLELTVRALDRFVILGDSLAVPPTVMPLVKRLLDIHGTISYRYFTHNPSFVRLLSMWSIKTSSMPPPVSSRAPRQQLSNSTSAHDRDQTTAAGDLSADSLSAANTLNAMRGSQGAARYTDPPPTRAIDQRSRPPAPSISTNQNLNFYNMNAQDTNDVTTATQSNVAVTVPQDVIAGSYTDQLTPDFFSEAGTNPDFDALFEEIAMLEGSRHAQDGAQFMQNLGVGPDLDLSTFFGADYQASSDPMLAYLQPGANNRFVGS